MPNGNATGPAGMGPMTGRAAGRCAGFGMPGFADVQVRGFGRGRGFGGGGGGGRGRGGHGRRNQFYATGLTGRQRAAMSVEQQLDMLKGQAENFQDALEDIRKRIEELQASDKKG